MAQNDFLISLVGHLDGTKSKHQLDQDINAIKKSLKELELKAKLDPNQIKALETQLSTLQIKLMDVSFTQSALTGLVDQINNALKGIQIPNIDIGASGGGGGNILVNNAAKLDEFRKYLSNIGMSSTDIDAVAQRIQNLDVQINSLNQSLSHTSGAKGDRNLLNIEVSGIDKFGQAVTLTQTWDMDLRQLVKDVDAVSSVTRKAASSAVSFIDKQKQAVATAKNSLSTIESKLNDKGANKTLANTDFDANGLNQQLDKVRNAIVALENANKNTFTQAKIDVDTEITSLNNLITTLRNAEYAATSLRTKDISTVKIDEGNNLNAFVQKMEQSGHYTDELKQKVANLRSQLNGVFDANTLTSYLNGLSNLQSEFKAVDATAKTTEKATKLQTNIDAEKKILQVYTNELKEAGVLTGEVKQKIQDMFHSLSKVDSQNGLITWRAELKGVKAETDAVLKSVTQLSSKKLDEIQFAIDTEKYSTQIFKLQEQLKRFGSESGEAFTNAEKSVEQMKTAYNGMKTSSGDDRLKSEKEYQKALTTTNNLLSQIKSVKANELIGSGDYRRSNFVAELNNYLLKNTAMTEQSRQKILQWIATLESADDITRGTFDNIKKDFKSLDVQLRQTGQLGLSSMDKLKQAWEKFGGWSIATGTLMTGWSKVKESVSELKEINTILTEISKTSDRTAESLKQLGDDSFEVASDYGRKASDYLTSVQEMNRSGFYNEQGNAMAEQSLLAQSAGDMIEETADKWILALNAAYKYDGEAKKINEVLDGTNEINKMVSLYRNIWLQIWLLSGKRQRCSTPRIRFTL